MEFGNIQNSNKWSAQKLKKSLSLEHFDETKCGKTLDNFLNLIEEFYVQISDFKSNLFRAQNLQKIILTWPNLVSVENSMLEKWYNKLDSDQNYLRALIESIENELEVTINR